MRKEILIILPLIFTAQACNILGTGGQGSGDRGVFVSTDGGQTWEERNTVNQKENLKAAEISRIFIEQNNPKNLLAATLNQGLFASDSEGHAWVTLLPGFAAYDAFINPDKGQEIFTAGSKDKQAVIYKSLDRGGTWVQIYNQPSGQASVTALAFDSINPDVLYAGLSTGTMIKSMDAGKTWNISADLKNRIVRIIIAPDQARAVYALARTQGLSRSLDGGRTWNSLPAGRMGGQFNTFILDPLNSNTLYLATADGLQKSQDGGATWNELKLPTTPTASNVTAVAVNPRNSRQIFASIRFNVYRSDDSGATWRTNALPTRRGIFHLAIDPIEPNRVYAGTK